MVWLKVHVSWRDLNRLADDELEADARVPAIEHVAACPKCLRRLSFLGTLRNAGRDMRHPAPPHELLEDVLRSRSEGVRVILPAIPASPRARRRALPAVAAAAIVAGLAFLVPLFLASEAGAGASELSFDPPLPVPGEEVRLTYRPTTELTGEAELRVRLHLRQPDSEPPRGTLGAHDEAHRLPHGTRHRNQQRGRRCCGLGGLRPGLNQDERDYARQQDEGDGQQYLQGPGHVGQPFLYQLYLRRFLEIIL